MTRRLFSAFDPYDRSIVRTEDELEALYWEGHLTGHAGMKWSAWNDLAEINPTRADVLHEQNAAIRVSATN